MSARVPFMPQRPASARPETSAPSLSSTVAHDSFRPNGLLSGSHSAPTYSYNDGSAPKDPHIATQHSAEAALKAATNKPLNVSGLAKRKPVPQSNGVSGLGTNRKSFDSSGADARSTRPFLPPSQAHRLSGPRPSSPFFLGSTVSGTGSGSEFLSVNGFRPPMLPVPSKLQTSGSGDNLNGNNAHIVTSDGAGDGNTSEAHSTNGDRYNDLRSLGSNNPERAHARPRVSSHPSLEKINEDEDEDDRGHPGGAHGQRASGSFPDDAHAGSDDAPSEASQPGLRRSVKRIHQQDFEEEEFAYGTQSKRYKLDGQGLADDLAARYSRGPTPDVRGYIAPEDYERGVPDPRAHSQQPDRPYSRMSEAHVHPQAQPAPLDPTGRGEALYKLMGQDLGEFVEGHVDAYEEAKKRWSECSMEEWTAGADELTTKFSKMLDFVKDHMTAKLSLYASLHSAVASHKSTLGEREKALVEARESLVREGGAVVGGGAVASAMQAEKPNGED